MSTAIMVDVMGDTSDDPPCSSCAKLKEAVEASKKEHALTLKMVKEKIISTDELIKKYQQKCFESDKYLQQVTEFTSKLEAAQMKIETVQSQLERSQQSSEPLRKNVVRLDREKALAETTISELTDNLQKTEKLYSDLMDEVKLKEEKECAWRLEKQVQAQELQKQKKSLEKNEVSMTKLQEQLKKEKERNKELSRSASSANRKVIKLEQEQQKYKDEITSLKLDVELASSVGKVEKRRTPKQRQERKPRHPVQSSDVGKQILIPDPSPAQHFRVEHILQELKELSDMGPVLSPLSPSPDGSSQEGASSEENSDIENIDSGDEKTSEDSDNDSSLGDLADMIIGNEESDKLAASSMTDNDIAAPDNEGMNECLKNSTDVDEFTSELEKSSDVNEGKPSSNQTPSLKNAGMNECPEHSTGVDKSALEHKKSNDVNEGKPSSNQTPSLKNAGMNECPEHSTGVDKSALEHKKSNDVNEGKSSNNQTVGFEDIDGLQSTSREALNPESDTSNLEVNTDQLGPTSIQRHDLRVGLGILHTKEEDDQPAKTARLLNIVTCTPCVKVSGQRKKRRSATLSKARIHMTRSRARALESDGALDQGTEDERESVEEQSLDDSCEVDKDLKQDSDSKDQGGTSSVIATHTKKTSDKGAISNDSADFETICEEQGTDAEETLEGLMRDEICLKANKVACTHKDNAQLNRCEVFESDSRILVTDTNAVNILSPVEKTPSSVSYQALSAECDRAEPGFDECAVDKLFMEETRDSSPEHVTSKCDSARKNKVLSKPVSATDEGGFVSTPSLIEKKSLDQGESETFSNKSPPLSQFEEDVLEEAIEQNNNNVFRDLKDDHEQQEATVDTAEAVATNNDPFVETRPMVDDISDLLSISKQPMRLDDKAVLTSACETDVDEETMVFKPSETCFDGEAREDFSPSDGLELAPCERQESIGKNLETSTAETKDTNTSQDALGDDKTSDVAVSSHVKGDDSQRAFRSSSVGEEYQENGDVRKPGKNIGDSNGACIDLRDEEEDLSLSKSENVENKGNIPSVDLSSNLMSDDSSIGKYKCETSNVLDATAQEDLNCLTAQCSTPKGTIVRADCKEELPAGATSFGDRMGIIDVNLDVNEFEEATSDSWIGEQKFETATSRELTAEENLSSLTEESSISNKKELPSRRTGLGDMMMESVDVNLDINDFEEPISHSGIREQKCKRTKPIDSSSEENLSSVTENPSIANNMLLDSGSKQDFPSHKTLSGFGDEIIEEFTSESSIGKLECKTTSSRYTTAEEQLVKAESSIANDTEEGSNFRKELPSDRKGFDKKMDSVGVHLEANECEEITPFGKQRCEEVQLRDSTAEKHLSSHSEVSSITIDTTLHSDSKNAVHSSETGFDEEMECPGIDLDVNESEDCQTSFQLSIDPPLSPYIADSPVQSLLDNLDDLLGAFPALSPLPPSPVCSEEDICDDSPTYCGVSLEQEQQSFGSRILVKQSTARREDPQLKQNQRSLSASFNSVDVSKGEKRKLSSDDTARKTTKCSNRECLAKIWSTKDNISPVTKSFTNKRAMQQPVCQTGKDNNQGPKSKKTKVSENVSFTNTSSKLSVEFVTSADASVKPNAVKERAAKGTVHIDRIKDSTAKATIHVDRLQRGYLEDAKTATNKGSVHIGQIKEPTAKATMHVGQMLTEHLKDAKTAASKGSVQEKTKALKVLTAKGTVHIDGVQRELLRGAKTAASKGSVQEKMKAIEVLTAKGAMHVDGVQRGAKTATSKGTVHLDQIKEPTSKATVHVDQMQREQMRNVKTATNKGRMHIDQIKETTDNGTVHVDQMQRKQLKNAKTATNKGSVQEKYRPLSVRPRYMSEVKYVLKCLGRLVEDNVQLDEVVERLTSKKCISSTTPVASAIVQFLKQREDKLTPRILEQFGDFQVDTGARDWTPVVSDFETRLVHVICRLSEHALFQNFIPQLVSLCSRSLISSCRGCKDAELKGMMSLCRILTALCKLKGDLGCMRVVCYDVVRSLYLFEEAALELVVAVIAVWPAVLQSPSRERLSLLRTVMTVLLTFAHNSSLLDLGNVVRGLCCWVDDPYLQYTLKDEGLELVEWLKNERVVSVTLGKDGAIVPDQLSFEVVKSLELLSCVLGWEWTLNELIINNIWEILKTWSAKETNESIDNTLRDAMDVKSRNVVDLKETRGAGVKYKEGKEKLNNDSDTVCCCHMAVHRIPANPDVCEGIRGVSTAQEKRMLNNRDCRIAEENKGLEKSDEVVEVCAVCGRFKGPGLPESQAVLCVRLIGLLCRIAVENCQNVVPEIMDMLCGLMEQASTVTYVIQLATAMSLLDVSPWQPERVAATVGKWLTGLKKSSSPQPPACVSQRLVCLQSILKSNGT